MFFKYLWVLVLRTKVTLGLYICAGTSFLKAMPYSIMTHCTALVYFSLILTLSYRTRPDKTSLFCSNLAKDCFEFYMEVKYQSELKQELLSPRICALII